MHLAIITILIIATLFINLLTYNINNENKRKLEQYISASERQVGCKFFTRKTSKDVLDCVYGSETSGCNIAIGYRAAYDAVTSHHIIYLGDNTNGPDGESYMLRVGNTISGKLDRHQFALLYSAFIDATSDTLLWVDRELYDTNSGQVVGIGPIPNDGSK